MTYLLTGLNDTAGNVNAVPYLEHQCFTLILPNDIYLCLSFSMFVLRHEAAPLNGTINFYIPQ